MKNRSLLIIGGVIFSSLLASCKGNIDTDVVEFESKEVGLYFIDDVDETSPALSTKKLNDFAVHYVKGQELLPYITFQEYVSLYDGLLKEGYSSIVNTTRSGYQRGVKKENTYYFIVSLDLYHKSFEVSGSLRNCLTDSVDYSKTGLNYQVEFGAYTIYDTSNRSSHYYYGEYNFNTYQFEGKYYLPLGLFDVCLGSDTSHNVFYNYEHLFLTSSYSSIVKTNYYDNGTTNIFDQMKNVVETQYNFKMPLYLRKYNESSIYCMFDNFYGLGRVRGINKMSDYIRSFSWSKNLLSENNEVRSETISKVFNFLDDDHTGLATIATPWNETVVSPRGASSADRRTLRTSLRDQREIVRTDLNLGKYEVQYSESGKTANILFDSFVFAPEEEFYEVDGVTVKPNAYKSDSFVYIYNSLREIFDEHPSVKNIVLDLSTNGGGVVGTMAKILSLISPDNAASFAFRDTNVGYLQNFKAYVDTNGDEITDENDVFGGKGKDFYILTSPCSFSCANAFPFIAKAYDYAKIIGAKSGGGQCTVGTCLLPNGQFAQYSSNLQIGYEDLEKGFIGDEGGAEVDISLNYSDFYDIEKIEQIIA